MYIGHLKEAESAPKLVPLRLRYCLACFADPLEDTEGLGRFLEYPSKLQLRKTRFSFGVKALLYIQPICVEYLWVRRNARPWGYSYDQDTQVSIVNLRRHTK